MRTYLVERNGVARVMRIYHPTMMPQDVIAQWAPAQQAEVGSIIQIDEKDLPDDKSADARQKWRINNGKLKVEP